MEIREDEDSITILDADIEVMNEHFLKYLNFGGYPEVIFSPEIQGDPGRFIKSDIIDKVLLRDLPILYGITNIQDLNSLFTMLAFNTANEISLEELAQNSGTSKNTIKRYVEYLEAAFLVRVIKRVDRNAKRFQRQPAFKVYLTNPSIRSALFSPIDADHEDVGPLAETAIFAQWFHSAFERLYYARWKEGGKQGEVDIVRLDTQQRVISAIEVKWSDRFFKRPDRLQALLAFCTKHGLQRATVTTRTTHGKKELGGVSIDFVPTSVYCFLVGYQIVRGKRFHYGVLSRDS